MADDMDWFENNYAEFWTLPYPPYSEQIRILQKIDAALRSGYKNIMVNAGTGIGKSVIATTIANLFYSAYICTKTINLQTQYMQDFKEILVELKGKKHYQCFFNRSCDNCYVEEVNKNGTIADKKALLNGEHGRSFIFHDNISEEEYDNIIEEMMIWKCSDCPYKLALLNAQNNNYVNANYHSLYFNSHVIPRFKKRDIIIFDGLLVKLVFGIFEFSLDSLFEFVHASRVVSKIDNECGVAVIEGIVLRVGHGGVEVVIFHYQVAGVVQHDAVAVALHEIAVGNDALRTLEQVARTLYVVIKVRPTE